MEKPSPGIWEAAKEDLESMLFLTDQFIPRPSSGNLATNYDDSSVIVSEDGEEEGNGDDIQIEQLETIVLAPNHPTNVASGNLTNVAESRNVSKTKTGYIKRVTPQTVIGQQLLELEKEKLKMKQNKAAENPNDEDIGFFNSLLPHMQVQGILFDMAYPHQQPMTASSTPYMALSPQHSATSSSTSFYPLYESGHEDATTGNTAADGGNAVDIDRDLTSSIHRDLHLYRDPLVLFLPSVTIVRIRLESGAGIGLSLV
ncbi:hypothetical protein J6590_047199 [Homalodisca vitripennis]|nr:hypothetical protein J6590_047199 [Homalodisca vitripennis]